MQEVKRALKQSVAADCSPAKEPARRAIVTKVSKDPSLTIELVGPLRFGEVRYQNTKCGVEDTKRACLPALRPEPRGVVDALTVRETKEPTESVVGILPVVCISIRRIDPKLHD